MNLCRASLTLTLIAAVSGLPLVASSGAIVTPVAGTVAINGQPVSAGSALLPGDTVTTSAAGSARLLFPGASLLAAARTRFRLEPSATTVRIRLRSGLVEVAGNLPVAVAARTVVPSGPRARFNVYDLAGEVYVTALRGALAIHTAGASYPVPAGTTVKFRDPQALPAPVAMKPSGISPLAAAGMAVAAAAASGAIVYFATRKKKSASPSSL